MDRVQNVPKVPPTFVFFAELSWKPMTIKAGDFPPEWPPHGALDHLGQPRGGSAAVEVNLATLLKGSESQFPFRCQLGLSESKLKPL